ncbi:MAG: hypothetical protein HY660_00805 [Armatimonadetes bacterium]|nr:hypothetical protein [Armatimonadota bacterium]
MHHSPKEMQQIANQYMQSGEPWPATARQIAEWAIRNKLWAPRPASIIEQCAELLSRAMREEYITDPQGRTVRAKHVVPMEKNDEQLRLWADIRTATRDHMEIAFAQRRQQIVGDCRQLKVDVDSYNQNANPDRDRPIQIEFDFTYDLQEIEALAAVR